MATGDTVDRSCTASSHRCRGSAQHLGVDHRGGVGSGGGGLGRVRAYGAGRPADLKVRHHWNSLMAVGRCRGFVLGVQQKCVNCGPKLLRGISVVW